ncbi:MAG: hypothetical protein KTR15_10850 [Phycisphaeraceae bacterium]|nr:hypothetical protein [Phycisphaeraceae bacterium]
MRQTAPQLVMSLALAGSCVSASAAPWVVDSQEEWTQAVGQPKTLSIADGLAVPKIETVTFRSKVRRFDAKRKAKSLTISQSPIWQNWEPIENLGPVNMKDAPVFLSLGESNYWAFGKYGKGKNNPGFKPKPATLEGFGDTKLLTTPFANQYDAPGGLKQGKGGYHAWQSTDMVNWVHHGPVTEGFSRWVTSAEHVDGKTYIFYDFPNDQDPHAYVDEDLTDGKPGKNLGLAFRDPSHGSDAGFIRDLDGNFHVIYEDWSPINANKRSWDSPLAGHAVSKQPVGGYKIVDPAVDNRTTPTGKIGTYKHPHWAKEDPKNYKTNVAEYEIHTPEQEAYGDWAAIAIGGQYYLFGDYDPVGGHDLATGWFTTDDINKPFTWCDKIGKGHPDPDIGFANGRFYLWTQQKTDYVSDGPWVEKIEARLGVDADNDGRIDQWTDWQQVKETYNRIEGFSKQVAKTPAALDASKLPAGFGFAFEMKLTDTTKNKSKPMIDRVTVEFE